MHDLATIIDMNAVKGTYRDREGVQVEPSRIHPTAIESVRINYIDGSFSLHNAQQALLLLNDAQYTNELQRNKGN